jgi:hypothetical protein
LLNPFLSAQLFKQIKCSGYPDNLLEQKHNTYPRCKQFNLASSIREKIGRPEIKQILDAKKINIDIKKIVDGESLT